MIVADIETSGLIPERCGIWQIGAIEFENPDNQFIQEARIDIEDEVFEGACTITGKSEQEIRNQEKQTQKRLLENFFSWAENTNGMKNIICQGYFDISFLDIKARKYGLKMPFHHRIFDLHSVAAIRHFQIFKRFLIEGNKSGMGLSNVLGFCGMKDERIKMDGDNLLKNGKPHNALEDARLEAECFSRLLHGKGIFDDYAKFEIPDNLKNAA